MTDRMLVVYYSWSSGNTKGIAEQIAEAAHADIARIETVMPYPDDYDTTVEQGQREVNEEYCPKIQPTGLDITQYQTIVIGTPTWWYTMAPAVRSFLKGNDFTGKKLIVFSTHAGWPGHALHDMKKFAKKSKEGPSKAIQFDINGGSSMVTADSEVKQWIQSIVKGA